MGGRTGRGEQVRSSPCIKLKARVLLQLSCLTTAPDRCAEQEWCHHCLCKLSFEEKQKGLPGTCHRWLLCLPSALSTTGPCPCPWRCQRDPGDPEPSRGGRMERWGFVPAPPGAQPGRDSGTSRSQAGPGQGLEAAGAQPAPVQQRFLGNLPCCDSSNIRGTARTKALQEEIPSPS